MNSQMTARRGREVRRPRRQRMEQAVVAAGFGSAGQQACRSSKPARATMPKPTPARWRKARREAY